MSRQQPATIPAEDVGRASPRRTIVFPAALAFDDSIELSDVRTALVLAALAGRDGTVALTNDEIAAACGVAEGVLRRNVARLESAGWIARRPDPRIIARRRIVLAWMEKKGGAS